MSFSIIRIFSYMLGIVGAALLLPFTVGCLHGEERAAIAFGSSLMALSSSLVASSKAGLVSQYS